MRLAAVVVLVFIVACAAPPPRSAAIRDTRGSALAPLRPLDEAHAQDLRRLFDEAKDHPRYIVALSPT